MTINARTMERLNSPFQSKVYTHRVKLDDALNWHFSSSTTLRWELSDLCAQAAVAAGIIDYADEGEITLRVEGEEFVMELWV